MNWRILFFIPLALFTANAAGTKTTVATLAMKYEGGTLPLGQGRTRATISEDKVVFTQGRRKLAIPLQNITAIACNTDVRRRFGASVLGVVPRLHLDTSETYYVGLSWVGDSREGEASGRAEGVFKLSSSEYGDFLARLQRLTGKKAVDTRREAAVVRYGL